MRSLILVALGLLFTTGRVLATDANHSVEFDLQGYRAQPDGVVVKHEQERLRVSWPMEDDQLGVLVLDLESDKPLIAELGIETAGHTRAILKGIEPTTFLTVGSRDLTAQGWSVFFDNPPRRPHETFVAKLKKRKVTVASRGPRAEIEIDSLSAGPFRGTLCLTVYPGCRLIHVEAVLSTEQGACAILYDAGLTSASPSWKHVAWIDTSDHLNREEVESEKAASPVAVRRRTIVAEAAAGSVAVFPPPHQYLYPLDFADNFQFVWHGRDYRNSGDMWGLGVRQPPEGDKRFVPWVNAPPKTKQRLGVFYLLSDGDAAAALAEAGKFTRGDRFKRLNGFRTFTSHYHVEHTLHFLEEQRRQGTTGVPRGLEEPGFVRTFKERGVDIVHLAEFHVDHSPDFRKQRLMQLEAMHRECRRLSDEHFLLLPGEEPNVHLGGHWISLFPRPVYWILHPEKDVPFERDGEGLGKVYAVRNSADVLKLMEKEKGLMWTAHPRTKTSFNYPDRYRREPFYESDRFLGAAWKAMPADLSQPLLGARVLHLFNDMANRGQQKYVLGEVDVFKVQPEYELYGHMNVNYVKLDELPRFDDGWDPLLRALRGGQFFVTTGEVLITDFRVNGKANGEVVTLPQAKAEVTAEIEWTFPSSFIDVIWGDGETTHHHRQNRPEVRAFSTENLTLSLELPNAKWVRLEAWDIAANGAFTQPVWVEKD